MEDNRYQHQHQYQYQQQTQQQQSLPTFKEVFTPQRPSSANSNSVIQNSIGGLPPPRFSNVSLPNTITPSLSLSSTATTNSNSNNYVPYPVVSSASSTSSSLSSGSASGSASGFRVSTPTNFSTPLTINSGGSVSRLAYETSQRIPIPPYATLKPSGASMQVQRPKRGKRRSKFSQQQDDIITSMKREGKSWMEIAEAAGVDSYLAARNRYQVLIGQQGGGTSECGPDEVKELQSILDEGEVEKFRYICKEFKKSTGRIVNSKDIRELLRMLFWKDPLQFDVDVSYLEELNRLQQDRIGEFGGDDREAEFDE